MATLYDPTGVEAPLRRTDLAVLAQPAANTGVTVTLPAVAGMRHYITGLWIRRSATAALAGSATLLITTTNLPGGIAWRVGNVMTAGGTQQDIHMDPLTPLVSSAANTATTIVLPAPGLAVLWDVLVTYYVAP